MADAYLWVRLVHVLGAALWLGAGVFHLTIIFGAVRQAGPAAGPFMGTVLRRGGFGKFYGPVSIVTILAGVFLYIDGNWMEDPFGSAGAGLLTVGVALGLAAFVEGLAIQMPLEMKMRKVLLAGGDGPPKPETMATLMGMGMKAAKHGMISVSLLVLAFLAMVGRTVA